MASFESASTLEKGSPNRPGSTATTLAETASKSKAEDSLAGKNARLIQCELCQESSPLLFLTLSPVSNSLRWLHQFRPKRLRNVPKGAKIHGRMAPTKVHKRELRRDISIPILAN